MGNNDINIPNKAYFTLKQCCELKGINYRTSCNNKSLQPSKYVKIGNRRYYKREIVISWLDLTDENQ